MEIQTKEGAFGEEMIEQQQQQPMSHKSVLLLHGERDIGKNKQFENEKANINLLRVRDLWDRENKEKVHNSYKNERKKIALRKKERKKEREKERKKERMKERN